MRASQLIILFCLIALRTWRQRVFISWSCKRLLFCIVSIDAWTALKDVAWYRSARVMLAIVSAWGYVFFYLLRNDLSMAIVCMVRDPLEHSDAVTTEAWAAWNRSSTQDLATASLTESRSVCDESYTRTVREKSQNTVSTSVSSLGKFVCCIDNKAEHFRGLHHALLCTFNRRLSRNRK